MRAVFRMIVILLGTTLLARVLWPTPQQFAGFSEFVKALLRPSAISFLTAFNEPMTPVLLSLAIVLAAVSALGYLMLITERRIAVVNELVKKVTSLGPEPESAPRLRAVQRCDAVTRVLQTDGAILEDWRVFTAYYLRSDALAVIRPSDFITIRSLERKSLGMAFFRKLPQYFIALGLILTFMGLVAGLYYASAGMRSANLDDARQALVMLLNAATFKFSTSIAGLASSLLVSVGYLRQHVRYENICEELCLAIEAYLIASERDPAGDRATTPLGVAG